MQSTFTRALLPAALCLASLAPAAAQTPTYQFLKKIALPGNGTWDDMKMDGERERLFVSHGDRVHVIDLNTNQAIGDITGLDHVHGIGLAKDLDKGYVANNTKNTVTVFDYNTFKVLKTLPLTGKKPDGVLYDSFSKQIFVFNDGSANATVIDAKTDKVAGTISLGGMPEVACTNSKGSIFNTIESTSEVVELDVTTRAVKHRFALAPGAAPTGVAVNVPDSRLFVVCRKTKTLAVLDAATGKIIQTLPIGADADRVIFEKELKIIVVANGAGTATIIHQDSPDQYRVGQTLATQPGQKIMVHRGTTHNLFLSGAEYKKGTQDIVPGTFGVSIYGPAAN